MGSFGSAISLELCQHRSVQLLTQRSPLRQVLIKQPGKALVVMTLKQMCQLVYQDVLQALHWFFCQLQIQPNAPGFDVARALFGLHTLDAPNVDRTPKICCHLLNSSGTSFSVMLFVWRRIGAQRQKHRSLSSEGQSGCPPLLLAWVNFQSTGWVIFRSSLTVWVI